jgi:hypothetical protein
MKATLKDSILTVEMPLTKGTLSKSRKSLIVFTTSGFVSVEGTNMQININVTKPK